MFIFFVIIILIRVFLSMSQYYIRYFFVLSNAEDFASFAFIFSGFPNRQKRKKRRKYACFSVVGIQRKNVRGFTSVRKTRNAVLGGKIRYFTNFLLSGSFPRKKAVSRCSFHRASDRLRLILPAAARQASPYPAAAGTPSRCMRP